mgnify:CR=1 FL=1
MAIEYSKKKLKDTIKEVDIFGHLPDDVIDEITENLEVEGFKSEAAVINKGDQGNCMYLILDGKVKIHDEDTVIAELEKGNYFGEFSLLDDEPRSMSVTATQDALLASMTQNDFYSLLNSHSHTTRDIIKALIGRLRTQNNRIISQMRERAEELEKQVAERTLDLQKKNEELSETLSKLEKTQEQLIMQEKLATLGQLTAGIAHEIKNPLNFVNNFAALSNDLLEELNEAENDEEKEEVVEALRDNLARIYQHGKRADSIVASMMLHARESSGEKMPTDINMLLNETLNLAYHGMPSSGTKIGIDFDKNYNDSIPALTVVQQDINRVFLNIFTNAIHAVREKAAADGEPDDSYKPTIKITTGMKDGFVIIDIEDNGPGIPDLIKQKIFNPFFTTKPTGQGTGLGLSISFDIIKAHGGDIQLESKENEFTRFRITIPVDQD